MNPAQPNIFKSILILLAGAGSAKLIGLLTMPIITRLYSPADFGLMALYTAIITLVSPALTLRYSGATPLPRSDVAAANVVALSGSLILLNGLLLTIGLALGLDTLLDDTSASKLSDYTGLIIIGLFASASYELATMWATRKTNFRAIARSAVAQALLASGTKLCMGLLEMRPIGLLLGQIFQLSGGIVGLLTQFKHDIYRLHKHISIKRMRYALFRYASFPFYRLPVALILPLTIQSPILIITSWFGVPIAGQLGLATSICALPASLISHTTKQAFYGEIARLGPDNPTIIYNLTTSVLKRLCGMAIVPGFITALFGPTLFEFIFGAEWRLAGEFARMLTLFLAFQFIATPFTGVFDLYNKQALFLSISIFRLGLVFISFAISYVLQFEPTMTVLTYSIAGAISHLASIVIVLGVLKSKTIQ